jgi:hypothetical protein
LRAIAEHPDTIAQTATIVNAPARLPTVESILAIME